VAKTVETAAPAKKKKSKSQGAEIWARFCKNKGAMVGLVIVILLALLAIFADVIIDYDTQVVGYNIRERLQWPNANHWFGTDEMGRDLFWRILYGTKYSFTIGVACALLAAAVGIPLGAIAGYFGGTVDDLIMRLMDIVTAIPGLLLGIVIVSALGTNMVNLIIAVGVGGVASVARITRASVMTVKNQEYVEAERCIGLKEGAIIFNHILPNCLSPIIVNLTLRVAQAIIAASSLSFLGLGVPEPAPEWGALLSAGRGMIREYSYLTMFPGIAILITVLALNMMGDGLRDAMDPKLRR